MIMSVFRLIACLGVVCYFHIMHKAFLNEAKRLLMMIKTTVSIPHHLLPITLAIWPNAILTCISPLTTCSIFTLDFHKTFFIFWRWGSKTHFYYFINLATRINYYIILLVAKLMYGGINGSRKQFDSDYTISNNLLTTTTISHVHFRYFCDITRYRHR